MKPTEELEPSISVQALRKREDGEGGREGGRGGEGSEGEGKEGRVGGRERGNEWVRRGREKRKERERRRGGGIIHCHLH